MNENTPWNELLDLASENGLEAHITISGSGHGALGFEVWPGGIPTQAGLEAAAAVTRLFDSGGQNANEIFSHCASMGAVFREVLNGPFNYRGPFMVAAQQVLGTGVTRQ